MVGSMYRRRMSDAAEEATFLTLHLAERLRQRYASHATDLGLAHAQMKTLMALDAGTATSMRSLADRIHFDPSNLTSIIDRLEARGYVERRGSEEDRRVKELVVTSDGEALRAEFKRRLAADPGPMAALTTDEIKTYRDLLRRALPDLAR